MTKLRFSNNSTTSSAPSSSTNSPKLVSRFSTETLLIKTPRLPSLSRNGHNRWFSSSPPSSPGKSPYQQSSSTSSDSAINISSPTLVGRGSLDADRGDTEVLEFAVEEKLRRGEGARLVGTVDDAFELVEKSQRTRQGRSGSGMSTPADADPHSYPTRPYTPYQPPPSLPQNTANIKILSRHRPRRSISGPPPSSSSASPTPPRPSREIPPLPTRPPPPQPSSSSPACIPRTALPPRSDSRNGFLPAKGVAKQIAEKVSSGSLATTLVGQSTYPLKKEAARSSLKLVETAPLAFPSSSSTFTPPSTSVSEAALPPFKALLLSSPTSTSLINEPLDSVLSTLKVNSATFVTTASTLIHSGRSGKLGSFVSSVIDGLKQDVGHSGRQDSAESIYPPSDIELDVEDCKSVIDPTHFNLSPFPSPFPFTRYESGEPYLSSLERDSNLILPELLMKTTKNLDFSTPVHPTQPHSTKALLVPSPLPHLRITSITPTIHSTPTPSVKPSSPTDDEIEEWTPSPHFSTSSEINPFEKVLSPYFDVLRGQPFSEFSSSPTSPIPVDVSSPTEEDKSRSTLLGVPRGLEDGVRTRKSTLRGPREMHIRVSEEPLLPSRKRCSTGESRVPSLCRSESSVEDVKAEEEKGIEVFLDRDQDAFEGVMAWIRDGALPPSLSLPPSPSSSTSSAIPNVDSTHLSLYTLHPASALQLLNSLRALEREAKWFEIGGLVGACVRERSKVEEMVKWIDKVGKREMEEVERKKRVELVAAREKAGWI